MSAQSKVKILVCAHKPSLVVSNGIYTPIQVGAALSDKELGFLRDDTGDNISVKNPYYCELTALYWAWKNLPPDVEYVGLNHYRRYFWFNHAASFIQSDKIIAPSEFGKYVGGVSENRIMEMLDRYDVILNRPWYYNQSVESVATSVLCVEDQVIFEKILLKRYPDYAYILQQYLRQSNRISHCNMLLTRRDLFDKYCEWLFPLLFEAEKYIKLGAYVNQRRTFGYLSEMFMRLFFIHNGCKIKYVPYVFVDESVQAGRTDVASQSNVLYLLRKWRKNFAFWMGNKQFSKQPFVVNSFIEGTLKNIEKIDL